MGRAEELTDSILHRYLTLVRYQRYTADMIRKQMCISGRQLALLRHVTQNGPCTVGQISQILYVRDATTSGLLDRMERAGTIVRRRSHEDKRQVYVEPTDLGRELAQRAPMGTVALLRARLPEQAAEDLALIDQALEKLSRIAEVDESRLD